MIEEEIKRAADSDPDALPLIKEQLSKVVQFNERDESLAHLPDQKTRNEARS